MTMAPSSMSRPPGISRTVVAHLVWEAVLLLGTIVAVLLLVLGDGTPVVSAVFANLAMNGFAAVGLALSLRTGHVNLAVGAVSSAAAIGATLLANDGTPLIVAGGVVVFGGLLVGVIVGALVGVTRVPAWAASLAFVAVVIVFESTDLDRYSNGLRLKGSALVGTGWSIGWTAVLVVFSLAGAVLFAFAPVRRLLVVGSDSSQVPMVKRLISAVVGFGGSSAAAALGGVLTARFTTYVFAGSGQVYLLLTAVAAVLLGGVGLVHRRGGFGGTILGVALVTLVPLWLQLKAIHAPNWVWFGLVTALAIAIGLTVSWLFDLLDSLPSAPPMLIPPLMAPPVPPQWTVPMQAAPSWPGPAPAAPPWTGDRPLG